MTTPAPKSKKPRSERRQRNLLIPAIRVTSAEKERIEVNAAGHSLTTADFLRRLGQHAVPASTLDRQAVLELLRVAGDLGRLGGLLKLWLSRQDQGQTTTEVDGRPIRALLDDLRSTQEVLKTKILALGEGRAT